MLRNSIKTFKRNMTSARAIVYSSYGEPSEVLKVFKYSIPDPKANEVVLQTLAHPVNPSDINQIEGVYPSRPERTTELGSDEPIAVAGNEGVSKVVKAGPDSSLKVGDWVIPNFPNYGTWRSHSLGLDKDYINLGKSKLSVSDAATLSVNACTAYELLTTINPLEKGDWFIQNAGTSGVSRFAVQLGRLLGYKSISVVRDRPNIDALKKELQDLGATQVITEEENSSKEFGKTVKEWTKGSQIKLALNSVGGKSSAGIARKLSQDGFIATYGGMSKQPVTFPTSLFIFKNITAKGYWITKNNFGNLEQKKRVVATIVKYLELGQIVGSGLNEKHVDSGISDADYLALYKEAIASKGKHLVVY